MSFFGLNFIYGGITGSEFGLSISNLGDEGVTEIEGANVEPITQAIYRDPVNYLLGIKQSPALSIPITFTVNGELTAIQSSLISGHLFGRKSYLPLQIVQPDMEYIYYNCILINPSVIKVGNTIRGYKATILCDSPFAWENSSIYTYVYNDFFVRENILINCTSDADIPIYPKLIIKTNVFEENIKITNNREPDSPFGIATIPPSETIVVNNRLQTVTSPISHKNYLGKMERYGYNWLKLYPGINILSLEGCIDYITIIAKYAKKIS